jgi:hypothetical protein
MQSFALAEKKGVRAMRSFFSVPGRTGQEYDGCVHVRLPGSGLLLGVLHVELMAWSSMCLFPVSATMTLVPLVLRACGL